MFWKTATLLVLYMYEGEIQQNNIFVTVDFLSSVAGAVNAGFSYS